MFLAFAVAFVAVLTVPFYAFAFVDVRVLALTSTFDTRFLFGEWIGKAYAFDESRCSNRVYLEALGILPYNHDSNS